MGVSESRFFFETEKLPSIKSIVTRLEDKVGTKLNTDYVSDNGCIIKHDSIREEICLDIHSDKKVVSVASNSFKFRYLSLNIALILYELEGKNDDLMDKIPNRVNRKLEDIKWWHFIPR